MVGMEQLEVHSRSYLIRWINVLAGNTISWSIQPHKKSLNFGVFKHPGGTSVGLPTPNLPSTPGFEITSHEDNDNGSSKRGLKGLKKEDISVVEKLEKLGMISVAWLGRCEAEKVTMGSFDVVGGEGGMYGLVFDNTFSKQVSKTVTFVLMTYPTGAPPVSGHHLHYSQANGSQSALPSPSLGPETPSGTIPEGTLSKVSSSVIGDPRPRSSHGTEIKTMGVPTFYTGILHKQRRKHHTYAKRFFSLDFTSSTLSYYQNRNSSALRGSIPLSLAVISTDEKSRHISVDSGAEVWHLRAGNQKDFAGWREALARASQVAVSSMSQIPAAAPGSGYATQSLSNPAEDRDWARAEALVGRVSGIRDAVRRLAQDCDPKYQPSSSGLGINNLNVPSPAESGNLEYFTPVEENTREKLPFWKRKSSSNNASPAAVFRRSFSAQLAVPMAGNIPSPSYPPIAPKTSNHPYAAAKNADVEGVHEHCMAILRDLDLAVSQFSQLISESKQRRLPPISPLSRRDSVGSVSDDEFFDAEDSAATHSGMLKITHDDSEVETAHEDVSDSDSESGSYTEFAAMGSFARKTREGQDSLFPTKPHSLTPLPLEPVQRRKTVASPKVAPPSLIGFLRKNVGKDLANIAMPVSANEPTSLLQRVSEQMEYSELLDAAANTNDATMRILNVTAFAISSFSSSRVKGRADRKPFNPMLGETFELVREDKGYRFIAEKISHRPVRMACQAEAEDWTFLQAPLPVQKFWGKSAELNTEGRARVILHTVGETYSWTLATSFLRNVIAGEKYVEPVSTMTIINEGTGVKAIATFKAGGMFAGRSEEVTVQIVDGGGQQLPQGLGGKWTSHLNVSENSHDTGKTLWKVGPLVDDAAKRYGFTTFAATLNQITTVEEGHIPPTDSRLRPDQRALEDGDVDKAEALKARLEERQRGRRRVMEEHGEEWIPKWFVKAGVEGGEEIWRLKGGKDGYWEARAKGEWSGVVDVLEV